MSYLDTYLQALDPLLSDPATIEIAINADGRIWLERQGAVHMAEAGLAPLPPGQVRNLAAQIANTTANSFTETAPLVSATVPYRAAMLRCQIVGSPAVPSGTLIGIRVFRPRTAEGRTEPRRFSFLRGQSRSLEAERRERMSALRETSGAAEVEHFLARLVGERLNVIVSGGTSTGKTELGRRLLELVSPHERIVTIEDSLELLPGQANAVSLIAQRDEASPRSAKGSSLSTVNSRSFRNRRPRSTPAKRLSW